MGRVRRAACSWWVASVLLAGCATDTTSGEARRLVARGALLVDVRTPAEFAERHPAEARNIPVEQLKKRLGELPRDKPVVVYCHTGARAGAAAIILRNAGYDVHVLGSVGRWYRDPTSPALY